VTVETAQQAPAARMQRRLRSKRHTPAPGSFQPGSPGGACPSTNVTVNLTSSTPTLNPGVVSPGTYSVQLRDAATNAVVGAMSFVAAGTAFYGSSPSRVGWSGGRRFVDSQRR